jgi:hypothetical protein
VPQYNSPASSGSEIAVRSERPRNANRIPIKAVVADGLLNSRGVGYSMLILVNIASSQQLSYELHGFTHDENNILICYELRIPDEENP